MALFGTQIVISMIMACVLQKLSIGHSFARWLLGRRLMAFMPPTVEQLKAAEGIKDDLKRHKRKNQEPDYKISKNVNVKLEQIPVTADDLSGLNFYPEYQWLLDFMAYTVVLYSITEVYLWIRPNLDEVNMSVVWCFLVLFFVGRTLLTLARLYFKSEETSSERSMCLVCGAIYLLAAMLVLIVDEKWIEFELRDAYDSFKASVTEFSREVSLETNGPTSELIFKLALAAWAGLIGALLVFPGIRFAQMHRDLLLLEVSSTVDREIDSSGDFIHGTDNDSTKNTKRDSLEINAFSLVTQEPLRSGPFVRVLLHFNFVFPLFAVAMWVTPLSRHYFTRRMFAGMRSPIMSADQFEIARIIIIIVACLLKLFLLARYLQAYLNIAAKRVQQLQREAGRIQISEFRRRVASVFNYACVVAVQYTAPAVLLLISALLLKTLGGHSWTGRPGMTPALPSRPLLTTVREADVSSSSALPFSLQRLKSVFSPVLFRGVLNFTTWWIAAATFTNSIIGYAFHAYNESA